MDFAQFATRATQVALIMLFAIATSRAARGRARSDIDATLFFGALAGLAALSLTFGPSHPDQPQPVAILRAAFALVLPVVLLRLLEGYTPVPRLARMLTAAGWALSMAPVLTGLGNPVLVLLVVVGYFLGSLGYLSFQFVRFAARTTGVTRRRMQLIGIGTGSLVVAAVISVVARSFPESEATVRSISPLISVVCGLCYLLAFAPPAFIRRLWQYDALTRVLRMLSETPASLPLVESLATLNQSIATAFGVPQAAIGLWNEREQAVLLPGATLEDHPEYQPDTALITRVFRTQHAELFEDAGRADPANRALYETAGATSIIIAPISTATRHFGVLMLFAPRPSLLSRDDLAAIQTVADQVAAFLVRSELVRSAVRVEARVNATQLKEDFLAAAAHELRTPLTGILGRAQLMLRRAGYGAEATPETADLLALIGDTKRLQGITDELLEVSQPEGAIATRTTARANLRSLVLEVIESTPVPDHVSIAVEGSASAEVDLERFPQALRNLLENAIKFSPQGGAIVVSLREEDSQVIVQVDDSGSGLTSDDLQSIFQRFFRGSATEPGTIGGMGLGLYLSQRIVDEHAGTITAEPRAAGGSRFVITIPARTASPAEAGRADMRVAAALGVAPTTTAPTAEATGASAESSDSGARNAWSAPQGWSLTTRVLTAAGGLLAMLLIILLVSYAEAANERRSAEVRNAADTGQAVAGIVDGFAREIQTTLLSAAIGIAAQPGEMTQAAYGPTLRAIAEDIGVLRALFIVDTNGRVIAASNGSGIGTDLTTRPYIRELTSGAETVWAPAVTGIETGEVTATYGRAMRSPDDRVRGYLVAAFYPPALAERISGRIPADADVTLIDSSGLAMHSTQHARLSPAERDLSRSPEVRKALNGAAITLDNATGLFSGETRYGVIVPVPTSGWAVAFTRPMDPLQQLLWERYVRQAFLVAVAVLGVALLLALATRHIARPLRELVAIATAVARGERLGPWRVGGSPEIRQLEEAMHAMETGVARREDELSAEATRRQILAETSRAFNEAGRDLKAELDTAARLVAESVRDGCIVYLLRKDTSDLEPAAVYHPSREVADSTMRLLTEHPVQRNRQFSGRAIEANEAMVIERMTDEARALMDPVYLEHQERIGLHSFISMPLRANGVIVGALATWRDRTPASYDSQDVELLRQIADRAGTSIGNARLIEEVREHAVTVERSMHAQEEFASLVAHDLRSPLAAIAARAQLTRRRLRRGTSIDPAQLDDEMQNIESSVQRAVDEIDASLDVARLAAGRAY